MQSKKKKKKKAKKKFFLNFFAGTIIIFNFHQFLICFFCLRLELIFEYYSIFTRI